MGDGFTMASALTQQYQEMAKAVIANQKVTFWRIDREAKEHGAFSCSSGLPAIRRPTHFT
jgi:hypothetical protein